MAMGEPALRKAIKWIDDQLHDRPGADPVKLIDEASRMFDLTPLDADFLLRHFSTKTS
jgi:hypothetical protein